jgi:predicted transcriptional regulator
MRNVEVELSEEVVEALDEEAEDRDETRSSVAVEMLDEWLSRTGGGGARSA